MKRFSVFVTTWVVLLFVSTGGVSAAPQNGLGICGGLASHGMDGAFVPPYAGGEFEYSSIGLSLGIDYQIALSRMFSLNPFLMSSAETVDSDFLAADSAGHGIFGLEGRFWLRNNVFFGVHLARYSEVLATDSVSISADGFGNGIAIGWENPDGRMFIAGQLDSVTLEYSDSDVDMTGFRFGVGYRWK